MTVDYHSYHGAQIEAALTDVASLRIRVFREYPYLYDGNRAYEERYLQGLARNERSLVAVARIAGQVVAAATALPLASDAEILDGVVGQFAALGLDAREFYYYSEIVVDAAHRGHGIAREFYRRRREHARSLGFHKVCFAAIQRDPGVLPAPAGYFDPAPMWVTMGFVKQPGIATTFRWPTLTSTGTRDMVHRLVFWLKDLDEPAPDVR